MAWRGSADGGSATNTTSVVITVSGIGGTGPQNGDIVIIHGVAGSTGATISSPNFSAVPGLSNVNFSNSGQTCFAPIYKVAGGSEPASYTITISINNLAAFQCNVFSGRNTAAPFTNVSSVTPAFGGFPITVAIPTLNAAALDDLLFLVGDGGNKGSNTSALTVPSGFGNVLDTNFTPTFETSAHSCNKLAVSAGATGTITGTLTSTSGANDESQGYLIAIANAPPLVMGRCFYVHP